MTEIFELLKSEIDYFKKLKSAIGDIHGHIHSLAVKMAQIYLSSKHSKVENWILSEKYGRGIDIIGKDKQGAIIIAAEIKTTFRSEKENLGSQQKDSIVNDINKLVRTKADFKYLIVIDDKNKKAIENILSKREASNIKLINISEKN